MPLAIFSQNYWMRVELCSFWCPKSENRAVWEKGCPEASAGDPPGIPRGGGRARGAAGDLFEKLPTIGRSALKLQHRIAAKSKPNSMEGIAKIAIWVLKMFLSRSSINSLKIYQKKKPEIVEGITKTAIWELAEFNQRQSLSVNVSQRCQAKWCPDRVPEPPFFTRRGPR